MKPVALCILVDFEWKRDVFFWMPFLSSILETACIIKRLLQEIRPNLQVPVLHIYVFPIVLSNERGSREWVRVWIDVSVSERPLAITKLSRQVREPLESGVAAMLMPEGHGEKPWHDDLDTMKILCGLLRCRLVNHNGVDATKSIVVDECSEIITQIQRWFIVVEI